MQPDIRWYTNPKGGLFRLSPVDEGWEDFVQIFDFTNPYRPYPMNGFKNVFWSDVDSPECVEAIEGFTQGGRRLSSLADMPVRYFQSLPENDRVHDVPWVFLIMDGDLRFQPNLEDHDHSIIPVSEVKSGTRLSTPAMHLFEMIYGDISVSRDTYEFLGPWREAAEYHVTKIRETEAKYPIGMWGPPGSENILSRYIADARIMSLESHVRLAYVYFGRLDSALTWACESWCFLSNTEWIERLEAVAHAIADDEIRAMKAHLTKKSGGLEA